MVISFGENTKDISPDYDRQSSDPDRSSTMQGAGISVGEKAELQRVREI